MDIRAYADMFALREIAQDGYSYLSQPIAHEGLVYRTDSGTLAVDGYELQDNDFCEFLYYDEWEDTYYWNTDRYFAYDEKFICSGEYIEEGKTIVRVRGDIECKYKRYRVGILALDGETWIDVGDFNDYDEALGYANYFLMNPHSSVCFDIDDDETDEDELFGRPLARIITDNNPRSTRYYML